MAGHSQFKNIMHRKGAQDKKRAKVFTKLRREIVISAKSGQPDPNFNPRLRSAIIAARKANMPKDNIDNAIKSAMSTHSTDNFEEIRYEGYGPGGIALIVEILTDNRNRTASEVRSAFSKAGGAMGETGSVSFMFEKLGQISYSKNDVSEDKALESSIEVEAKEYLFEDDLHLIFCEVENFHETREKLQKLIGDPEEAKLVWKPNSNTIIEDENAEKLLKLLEVLEDNDDVQEVFGNFEFKDEFLQKLN